MKNLLLDLIKEIMEELNEKIDVLTARVKELEQQLEERSSALTEASQDLESFTYKISHDLHAPLRAINTYMEMIRSDFSGKPLDDDAQRMIGRVMSNTEEMKQMLDGLLEFSRAGKKEVNLRVISMNNLVKQICNDIKEKCADQKITFLFNDLPDVKADEELMKKVWTHLIDNAVKFSSKKTEAIIEFGAEAKKNEMVYFIKDNGDGFDMAFYAKLFGVFQRLHHKTEFAGTGIGLAIINRILTRHQGKVWAEAKVKEGATFYFSLPEIRA
jgi:light-regulated signal transduction histidine kinase (bacteriophytochrome)